MAYSKNAIIMQQGQHGAEMYCVIQGEVEVERDGEKLGILGQDSYFGEQQFLAAVLGCVDQIWVYPCLYYIDHLSCKIHLHCCNAI